MGWTVYNSDGKVLQSAELGDNAVTSAKIIDDAVTYAKMQNLATADRVLGSTSTGLIGEVQIVEDMLATNAVTNVKVATGIDAIKLADGSVTNTELQYINSLSSNAQTQISAKAAVGSGTPSTQTLPDTAATGSSTEAARLDHVHTMPSAGGGGYDECARVYSDTAQSFANGATDALAFNQERFDTDAIHDNSTNNTRLTCKTAGVYVISGTIQWAFETSATHRRLAITHNGNYIDFVSHDESPATGHKMTITTIWKMAVNDYVELKARQNSGSALSVTVNSYHSPEFAMARIAIG